MQATPEKYEWGYYSLPKVWEDFSRGEEGIVFTVWDLTRLLWLACPKYSPDPDLRQFLENRNFALWGYIPIDSVGAGQPRPDSMTGEILSEFSRICAYTKWGEGIIRQFLPDHPDLSWCPHGLNLKTWRPNGTGTEETPHQPGNDDLSSDSDPNCVSRSLLNTVGVVATNQSRKNWGLMAEVGAQLRLRYPNLKLWWHTDSPIRYWNLPALAEDFELTDIVEMTTALTDKELAARYRGCSVTLHPGMGEGFCFPIFESLACGTPVVHGAYGGGAETLKQCGLEECLVPVDRFMLDGQFNCQWALYRSESWVNAIDRVLTMERAKLPQVVEHLGWQHLWHPWKKWFLKGIGR